MSVLKPDYIRDEIEYRLNENEEEEMATILNVSNDAIEDAVELVINDFDWTMLDDLRARVINKLLEGLK